MPKYNKNKRQRRQNALKMNEILKRRKNSGCEFDDKNNYSSLPITENNNGLNTSTDDTSVKDLSQETIELQDICLDSTEIVEDVERPDQTLTVEFTEIGDSVPFQIIKIEPSDELPIRMGVSDPLHTEKADQSAWIYDENCPGPSDVNYPESLKRSLSGSSSPPITKQIKTEPELSLESNHITPVSDTSNVALRTSNHEDASSDGDDMEFDNEFQIDSEYTSDSDDATSSGQDSSFDEDSDDSATNNCATGKSELDYPLTRAWSSEPTPMKNFAFNMTRQLLIPPPQDPYQAFRLFFDDKLLDTIVHETNNHAAHTSKAWKPLNREELVVFLGLYIHTGTIRMNYLGDYWRVDYLFNLPCFSRFMGRNRFIQILNSLSFSSDDAKTEELDKIRPIMDSFNEKMNAIYYPGKVLFLAKPLTFWQGQKEGSRQNKFELLTLAEPYGVVIKYLVHDCSTSAPHTKISRRPVVLELLEEKLDRGHSLYMGEYYSSYKLAEKLLARQTYCSGPLNKRWKANPFKLNPCKLKRYETETLYSNGIHIGKWKNLKAATLYITTEFENDCVSVIDGGVLKGRPKALDCYSKCMTSTELHKQLKAFPPCGRKTMPWHKKVFIQMLQMCMHNAFHLYNEFSGQKKLAFYDFRLFILKEMLPEPLVAPPSSILSSHILSKITRTKTRKRNDNHGRVITEVIRKKCRACRLKKKTTYTTFECLGCEGAPGYCTSCFCEVHACPP